MAKWPKQSNCGLFYGNPLSPSYERENIVRFSPPFRMWYGASPVAKIAVHRKCKDAFLQWLDDVWDNAGHDQTIINRWGMSAYSGGWNVRQKRGGSTLSMHAYGCALDFDAARNGFGDKTPFFGTPAIYDQVVKPFLALGGTWGGKWSKPDGMHFQLANVG